MLTINDKINFFKKYLLTKNNSYADVMKEEIYFYFDDIDENIKNFRFLEKLNNFQEIEAKIDFLISKMIMLEDVDGFNNIIEEYIN